VIPGRYHACALNVVIAKFHEFVLLDQLHPYLALGPAIIFLTSKIAHFHVSQSSTHVHDTRIVKVRKLLIANHLDQSI
jgi:hypothetical protein